MAFDKVQKYAVLLALRRKGVPERLIRLVSMLYCHFTSKVKVASALSDEIPINVGIHQGTALSPIFFIPMLDKISMDCRKGDP